MDRTVRDVDKELFSILHRMDELLLAAESAVCDMRLRMEAGEAWDPCLDRIHPLLVPLSGLYQELRTHRGLPLPREGDSSVPLQRSIDTARTRLIHLLDTVRQVSKSAEARIRELVRDVESSAMTPGAQPVGAVPRPPVPAEFGDPRHGGGVAE